MATQTPIIILDSTLREGEQSVGVCFSVAEKIHLVNSLKQFGVRLIEIGHPGISAIETKVCQTICQHVTGVELLVHARACETDIIAAKQSQAHWVGIWISYNDIALSTKFKQKTRKWIAEQVHNSVSLAKKLGLRVRFTIEDASRTEWALIAELGTIAVQAGADRISLADTVGIWHPQECFAMVKKAVDYFSCEIEVHLHNDLGLAQANAIAALDAGATVIDGSVLGIGERTGICDLFTLAAVLEKFYAVPPYNWAAVKSLPAWVARIANFHIAPHHPIIGRHAFTHVSHYHIKATVLDPNAYESLIPERYANTRKIALNSLIRKEQKRFSNELKVSQPFIKGASELAYHRDGVGQRWVHMDNRIDARSTVYIIERIFDQDYSNIYQPHVDAHAHYCDSFFVFMGTNPDGTGLEVSVTFGLGEQAETQTVSSPASVFIPANKVHSYAYIRGTGRFLNIVLSGNYNQSLV